MLLSPCLALAQPPGKLPFDWVDDLSPVVPLAVAPTGSGVGEYPNLLDRGEAELQQALEVGVQRLGLKGAVNGRRLGVAVADITDPLNPRFAAINGNRHFYAASLPKIAILLGVMQRVHDTDLPWNDQLRGELERMIRVSSNRAATAMYNLAEPARIQAVLTNDRYRLYDTDRNGGLWVGKPYGKGGAYKRDPLHNTSHGATAEQVARFFYLMETGRLVSYSASERMKAMLGTPGIKHKFVAGLAFDPDAKIFRKSGTWRFYHADGASVERNGRHYIAVGLMEDAQGGTWLKRLIKEIDTAVFSTVPEQAPEFGPQRGGPTPITAQSVGGDLVAAAVGDQ